MAYEISNKGSTPIDASDVINSNSFYKYTGSQMTICDTAAFSETRENMGIYDVTVASGETKTVWIGICVPISQGMPFVKLQNGGYINTNPKYISKTNDTLHKWDSGKVTKEATNTASGTKVYTCSTCKQTKQSSFTKKVQTLTVSPASKTLTASTSNAQSFTITAKVLDKAKVTYKSDNKSIVVDSKGKVTVKKGYAGKATITITAAATKNYAQTAKKITVTVNKANQPLTVSPTAKTYKVADVKKKAQTLTLKVTKAQGAVTYNSNNTKYVTVTSKGKVSIKKDTPKGKYTITVTAAGNSTYNKGSKTVTITVK